MSALAAAHPALGRRVRSAAAVPGVLVPAEVFIHPAAQHAPWKWALVHGAFVLAASVAYLVNWRLSERQAVEISRLVSRLEGLARTDPLAGVPNRRVWEEELPRELERARRRTRSPSWSGCGPPPRWSPARWAWPRGASRRPAPTSWTGPTRPSTWSRPRPQPLRPRLLIPSG